MNATNEDILNGGRTVAWKRDRRRIKEGFRDLVYLPRSRTGCNARLVEAAAVEVFSTLYATIDPWEALEHGEIFAALERICGPPREASSGKWSRKFALAD